MAEPARKIGNIGDAFGERAEPGQVIGNKEVVGMLEHRLAQAKLGKIDYAAIVLIEGKSAAQDYTGNTLREPACRTMLKILEQTIADADRIRQRPPVDVSLDPSYVCYNLTSASLSWDFLIWLVDAEMTRVRRKAPHPLRVCFSFGADNNRAINDEYKQQIYDNVLRPLVPLMNGAVIDAKAIGGRHKEVYTLHDVAVAAKAGEPVPKFDPTPKAKASIAAWLYDQGFDAPITITLREAPHFPHRNSNIPAWLKFANDLKAKGHQVLFVRDTAFACEPLEGQAIIPQASFDVSLRLALYQQAKANLCISNGPAGLTFFTDRPWLYFIPIQDHDIHHPNRPGWWYRFNGIPEGGQLPWATGMQRFIWKPDSYENLCAAWEEFGCG